MCEIVNASFMIQGENKKRNIFQVIWSEEVLFPKITV